MPLTRSELFLIDLIEIYVKRHNYQPNDEIIMKLKRELVPRVISLCEEGWYYKDALSNVFEESGL